MAPALPYVAVGLGVMQASQQNAAGKYNQSIQNRNAQLADQEATQIEKQAEFDLARFDQNFAQLQSQTTTRILKSGAELGGTGIRVLRRNAEEAEVEKHLMVLVLLVNMQLTQQDTQDHFNAKDTYI